MPKTLTEIERLREGADLVAANKSPFAKDIKPFAKKLRATADALENGDEVDADVLADHLHIADSFLIDAPRP